MFEIRIDGRGGQGAVPTSTVLAQAFVDEGKFAVAVPSFGFERRDAPASACLRVDGREIRSLTNVYRTDCVICVDPTLPRMVDIFVGVKPGVAQVLACAGGAPAALAGRGLRALPIARAAFTRALAIPVIPTRGNRGNHARRTSQS